MDPFRRKVSESLRALSGLALVVTSAAVALGGLAITGEATTAHTSAPGSASAPDPTGAAASAHPSAAASDAPPAEDMSTSEAPGCTIPDPGTGPYREVALGVANARLHVPAKVPEHFTLLVHFHGGEPVRRLLANRDLGLVYATIDAGTGSQRYAATVDVHLRERLFHAVENSTGRTIGKLVLSSWSAGYGAMRAWLTMAPGSAQALVFLDSIHASYGADGTADPGELRPFFELASHATNGSPFMWLSHSAIVPPGYASTTEVADAILQHVQGQRRYDGLQPEHGVLTKTRVDRGAFHVRGTTGGNEAAHCAHLKMLPAILERDVLPYLAR